MFLTDNLTPDFEYTSTTIDNDNQLKTDQTASNQMPITTNGIDFFDYNSAIYMTGNTIKETPTPIEQSTFNWCLNSPPPSVESRDPNQEKDKNTLDNEQSYDFESTANGELIFPLKNSQDYDEAHTFAEEINQVYSCEKEFTKSEYNFINGINNSQNSLNHEQNGSQINSEILYRDTMMSAPFINEPIEHVDYVMVMDSNSLAKQNSQQQSAVAMQTPTITVESSQTSEMNNTEITNNNYISELPDRLLEKKTFDANDRHMLALEHNYTNNHNNIINNINEISNLKQTDDIKSATPVMGKLKLTRQLRPLKAKSLKLKLSVPGMEQQPQMEKENNTWTANVSTPEITNSILEMENEKFDLISYIDSIEVSILLF